jgi:hypothetical protein
MPTESATAESASPSHPCGQCECRDGCRCEAFAGPAAWTVNRDGRILKVCSRCTLSGDTDRKLLVTNETPSAPFEEYDDLGFFLICSDLNKEKE